MQKSFQMSHLTIYMANEIYCQKSPLSIGSHKVLKSVAICVPNHACRLQMVLIIIADDTVQDLL
jgi:hypothetical protein